MRSDCRHNESLFEALVQRATVSIELGHVQRGLADIERARRLQAEHGWLDTDGLLAVNGVVALIEAGELERALALAAEGLQMSAALGVQPWWDPWILPGIAFASFFSGAWQEADGPLAAARAFGVPGQATVYNETVTALIAAGRGDLAACDQAIAVIDQHAAELIGEWHGSIALVRAARADAAGDPYGRLEQAELGLQGIGGRGHRIRAGEAGSGGRVRCRRFRRERLAWPPSCASRRRSGSRPSRRRPRTGSRRGSAHPRHRFRGVDASQCRARRRRGCASGRQR